MSLALYERTDDIQPYNNECVLPLALKEVILPKIFSFANHCWDGSHTMCVSKMKSFPGCCKQWVGYTCCLIGHASLSYKDTASQCRIFKTQMIPIDEASLSREHLQTVERELFMQLPSHSQTEAETQEKTKESDESHYLIEKAATGTSSNRWNEYVSSGEQGL